MRLEQLYQTKNIRTAVAFSFLAVLLFGVMVLALVAGKYDITPVETLRVLFNQIFGIDRAGQPIPRMHEVIVWNIRAPRLLIAIVSGVALSCAGAAYQGCFRNPLVEPFILGVSSGAAFGAALAIVLPHVFLSTQISAFVFSLGAVTVACTIAKSHGETPPMSLVLSGIIIGSLFTAMLGIMKYMASDTELRDITFWVMGGFYYATWRDVGIMVAVVLPAVLGICAMSWRLNLLSLGDEEARALGIHPSRDRIILIFLATIASATCVATVGIIAWVGLMMPHAARMILGPDNRVSIPAAALMGGIYLVVCDTIARTLTNSEIPIGIIASLIGAPYLLWLLRIKGKEMYHG